MGHFCPPGSGSVFKLRIRIQWSDWIRIQYGSGSGSETLIPSVPDCLSHRRHWVPTPLPRKLVCLPSWTQRRGEQHSLADEGVGGPNSDDWIESLALCILCAGWTYKSTSLNCFKYWCWVGFCLAGPLAFHMEGKLNNGHNTEVSLSKCINRWSMDPHILYWMYVPIDTVGNEPSIHCRFYSVHSYGYGKRQCCWSALVSRRIRIPAF